MTKNIMKKGCSLLLILAILILSLLSLLAIFPIEIEAAGNVSNELWMMEGYQYMMIGGSGRQRISDNLPAPYYYQKEGESRTVYVPVTALVKYLGGSAACSFSESTINITTADGTKCVLTKDSVSWTKGGAAQSALLLPPVIKDNEVYLSNMSIKTVFGGLYSFINQDTGLIVYSTMAISYNTSYDSLVTQIGELDGLLFEIPTAVEIYDDVNNKTGVATHPKLLVKQSRFDELRTTYNLTGNLTAGQTELKEYIGRIISTANGYFLTAFKDTDTGADWKNSDSAKYFRQPYYVYDASGNRYYVCLDASGKPYDYIEDKNGNRVYRAADNSYTLPDGTVFKLSEFWQNSSNTSGAKWNQSSIYSEGYDSGGRVEPATLTKYLKYFAFAWQITREQKWVDAFWLTANELGKWEHWGEGEFIKCADAAVEFALGFDWIYPAFSGNADGELKLRKMAETLFILGVETGYYAMKDGEPGRYNPGFLDNNPYDSAITEANLKNEAFSGRLTARRLHQSQGRGKQWAFNWTNNWQTVSISGMVISALAVMEYSDMKPICTETISKMLGLVNNCLHQYAPDGSYLESLGYWDYSTNTFMRMISALKSTTGKTYGFLDTVGLKESYFFAMNILDSSYNMWPYHDSAPGATIDGSTYYMAGNLYGDKSFSCLRASHLKNNSRAMSMLSIDDVLFYRNANPSTEGSPLDYYGKNAETVTMRSEWNSDAIFTGLHAGSNVSTHSDMDSGNFYYATGNVVWFGDLGRENYNLTDYNVNATRYKYYKKSIISHNSVFLVDERLPYGQALNELTNNYSKMQTLKSDVNGSIAIADMTSQFNPISTGTQNKSITTSAKRGLLFTNSRKTVVIQDEMIFNTATTAVWSSEIYNINGDKSWRISDDGKTVYITSTKDAGATLRVSLISPNSDLRFEIVTDKSELYLAAGQVITKDTSGDDRASNPGTRLVVKSNNTTSLNMAVVIETITGEADAVGYTYTNMDAWQISSDEWLNDNTEYGSIPADYANADTYPVAAFDKNGTFISAGVDFDEIIATLTGENYRNLDGMVILLRADAVSDNPESLGYISGKLTVDLGGHRLIQNSGNLFNADCPPDGVSLGSTQLVVKNGTVEVSGGGAVVALKSELVTYTGATVKSYSFSFENVIFEASNNTTVSDNFLFSQQGSKPADMSLTFRECTFNIPNTVGGTMSFIGASDGESNVVIDFVGGRFVADTLTGMESFIGDGPMVSFAKGSEGEFTTLTLNTDITPPGETFITSLGESTWVKASVTAGKTVYKLMPKLVTDFNIKTGVILHSNLILNVYVLPTDGLEFIEIDGVTYLRSEIFAFESRNIDGDTYYCIPIELAPRGSLADVVLKSFIRLSDGTLADGTYTLGLIPYAERALSLPGLTEAEAQVIRDMLSYVRAAYAYFGTQATSKIDKINSILGEGYDDENAPGFVFEEVTPNADSGITEATFVLDAVLKVRFKVKNDVDLDKLMFRVENRSLDFTVDGEYVYIELYAYEINRTIQYSVNGKTFDGSYNLKAYYDYKTETDGLNEKLITLVERLAKYAESADNYRKQVN